VIPHTAQQTILRSKKPGDPVNLENDIIGKYVEKLLSPVRETGQQKSAITKEFLYENGF
jgi:riboflavin synthase